RPNLSSRRSSAASMARAREVVEGLAINGSPCLLGETFLPTVFGFRFVVRELEVSGCICRLSLDICAVASPLPVQDLGHVLAVFVNVLRVVDQLVAHGLLCVSCLCSELRHSVDNVLHEVEAVHVV